MLDEVRVGWTTIGDEPRRSAAARLVRELTGATLRHGPCVQCGGDHGRPQLSDGRRVSLAYTGGLVVVALDPADDVGVDAESGAATDPATIDRLIPGATLRDWTRLEAAYKAVGLGLTRLRDAPTVGEAPDGWRTVVDGRVVTGRDVTTISGVVISVAVAAAPAAPPARSTP